MTDKDLIERGYVEFSPSPFASDGITTCFQKWFKDENGKRYFITVNKWIEMRHPYTGATFPSTYEYETQLYKKNTHDAVNILFHSSWSIEDVEDYMAIMFDSGLFDYYEER